MAARAKALDNMTKNLTADEIAAREQAEAPLRGPSAELRKRDRGGSYVCPTSLGKKARTVWRAVLKRTEDVDLLEDPDIHMLEIYSDMVSRISTLNEEINKLEERLDSDFGDEFETKDWLQVLKTMDSLQGKVLTLEKTVLSYADKLGLTPSSRAHLARKRADGVADEDPDGDMFG